MAALSLSKKSVTAFVLFLKQKEICPSRYENMLLFLSCLLKQTYIGSALFRASAFTGAN